MQTPRRKMQTRSSTNNKRTCFPVWWEMCIITSNLVDLMTNYRYPGTKGFSYAALIYVLSYLLSNSALVPFVGILRLQASFRNAAAVFLALVVFKAGIYKMIHVLLANTNYSNTFKGYLWNRQVGWIPGVFILNGQFSFSKSNHRVIK